MPNGNPNIAYANKKRRLNGDNSALEYALYNDSEPRAILESERPWHRKAIEMSASGYTVREIAIAMEVTPQHLQNVLRQKWAREYMINRIQMSAHDEMRQLLEAEGPCAVKRIINIASDPNAEHSVRLRANESIVDRLMGKAVQPISHSEKDMRKLSDTELERIASTALVPGGEAAISDSDNGNNYEPPPPSSPSSEYC